MKSIAKLIATVVFASLTSWGQQAEAASPESIQQGKQLFERSWKAGNPSFGSDGLGPVFNADSCVACHHQGGVGGSGDSRFNAQAIGIEWMRFSQGEASSFDVVSFLRNFYPGFIGSGLSVTNTAPLPHHSVAPEFAALRKRVLNLAKAQPTRDGGAANVHESRIISGMPIRITETIGKNQITTEARIFQRNTTTLFGAGLIDSVEDSQIHQQVKKQQRHAEISGRASVLRDGTLGRFGWRANASRLVHFVDRACANELGLETERRAQPSDPTRPNYRNPATDITDGQIEAMSEFVASLPAPIQVAPSDPSRALEVRRGQEAFVSVGCAVCHVPKMGPAVGIYSDLLLHDMGPNLYDYDAAEPHVVRQNLTREVREVPSTRRVTSYYGASSLVLDAMRIRNGSFASPRSSSATRDYVTLATTKELGTQTLGRDIRSNVQARYREELGFDRILKPSNTAQEWRTPPLWGLRDSAPYMHDGRAETVLEAISMHDGESAGTRDRFLQLSLADRNAVFAFLETLVSPPNVPQPAI